MYTNYVKESEVLRMSLTWAIKSCSNSHNIHIPLNAEEGMPGLELYLDWNFASAWNFAVHGTPPWHGTLPRLELCPAWNSASVGTLPCMELCRAWNSTPPRTLPRLKLCLGWNFAPPKTMLASARAGTLPYLELCLAWNHSRLELCPDWNSALHGTLPWMA